MKFTNIDGSGVRFNDGPDIKLFILVGWGRSFFLSVAWSTGVPLLVFLCSIVPVVLFDALLHIQVRLSVLLCAVRTIESDFRFCWAISLKVGHTHKENPNFAGLLLDQCLQFANSTYII